MTDWFKVQMNEADRRITLEVYAKNLVDAIESHDVFGVEIATKILKEELNKPFDKYEGAE